MKQIINNDSRRSLGWVFRGLMVLVIIAMPIIGVPNNRGVGSEVTPPATPPVPNMVNVAIDYIEETAMVTAGTGGSTKFYVSKDGMKNWEAIEPYGLLDLSTLLKPKETIIHFKGNRDMVAKEVKLPAQDTSLKATYSIFSGEGRIFITGTNLPIEYRKGNEGQWKPTTTTLVTTPYETYGATLHFRTIATATRRAGRVVSVKVSKKPSAPSIKLDGSRLIISGLKPGETQYRLNESTAWSDFQDKDPKLKTMDLKDLLAPTVTGNAPLPAAIIEFRVKATDKKVASAVRIIEVPAQAPQPENITLTGTTLTVADTNKRNYYEYTKVAGTATLNIKTAKWSSFTSAKPVVIKGASVGERIYVRAKSYTDKVTRQVVPASVPKELLVTHISQ